ncbi:MAG: hypothetical protein LBI37_00525, partial [Puniceicoccales bacterium]|nr:hypothetical protein [Puniceicoccales bacterium]
IIFDVAVVLDDGVAGFADEPEPDEVDFVDEPDDGGFVYDDFDVVDVYDGFGFTDGPGVGGGVESCRKRIISHAGAIVFKTILIEFIKSSET